MNGAAAKILDSQPPFTRPVEVVQAVKSISNLQYTICTSKFREFANAIFVSPNRNEGKDVFKLKISPKLKRPASKLTQKFLKATADLGGSDGEDIVRRFLKFLYAAMMLGSFESQKDSDSDEDTFIGISNRHRIKNLDM